MKLVQRQRLVDRPHQWCHPEAQTEDGRIGGTRSGKSQEESKVCPGAGDM